jgi:hypothetical protein
MNIFGFFADQMIGIGIQFLLKIPIRLGLMAGDT